jgi:hypothetical protein
MEVMGEKAQNALMKVALSGAGKGIQGACSPHPQFPVPPPKAGADAFSLAGNMLIGFCLCGGEPAKF